jgi:hypothetical protein
MVLLTFTTSCSREQNKDFEWVVRFFESDIYITTKDKDVSFIFSEEKFKVISPEILNGAEIIFEDNNITSNYKDYEINLPQSFVESLTLIREISNDLEKREFSNFKSDNKTISYKNCFITPEEDYYILKTENKEFILKKGQFKDNEKDISNG